MIVQCILRVLFDGAAVNTTCLFSGCTNYMYVVILLQCIHHCGTVFVSSVFFLSTIGLQYISHLKQKKNIVENNVKLQVYMYVCKISKS